MSVFVAYRNRDIAIVERIVESLSSYIEATTLWFAPRDIHGVGLAGEEIFRQIDQCDAFLYCLGSTGFEELSEEPDDRDDPATIHLSKEAQRAMDRLKQDPDFHFYCIRIAEGAELPPDLAGKVNIEMDLFRPEWEMMIPKLANLITPR